MIRPASVADPPRTPWTNRGMYVSIPKSKPPIRKLPHDGRRDMRPDASGRSAGSDRPPGAPAGRRGPGAATAGPATPSPSRRGAGAAAQDGQQQHRRAGRQQAAPPQSIGGTLSRCSSARGRTRSGSKPRGPRRARVTKKTQRQESRSVKTPPMAGPIRLDPPQTALKSPWTLARSRSVNRSPIIVMTIGPTAPAPRPWMIRMAISFGMLREQPDRIEPRREQPQPEQEHALAAEQVGELAVNRGRHRRREQVGREDPGIDVEPVQLGDDARHRRRDDRLLQRRHGHRQQQGDRDHPPVLLRRDGRVADCRDDPLAGRANLLHRHGRRRRRCPTQPSLQTSPGSIPTPSSRRPLPCRTHRSV